MPSLKLEGLTQQRKLQQNLQIPETLFTYQVAKVNQAVARAAAAVQVFFLALTNKYILCWENFIHLNNFIMAQAIIDIITKPST
mmetsp:Transcript_12832/g.19446  ORF Transcript_12832/g.19446 Transcript_12832/m.19446 type:complete len:84 (+) Transcript_12832:791-1042(+)